MRERPIFGKRPPIWHDALAAGACAAIVSAIPSTLYAWWTGGDVMEATRAAGAMLIASDSSDAELFSAAAVVHIFVSAFWSAVLTWLLPRERTMMWAIARARRIALLDLRVIAPLFFPEVYALPFWPQFADHLAFGATLGAVLQWRFRQRGERRR